MSLLPRNYRGLFVGGLLAILAAALVALAVWHFRPVLPAPGSPLYAEYLREFQVGVAALDAGREEIARRKLDRAIELVPAEPAGWADRGILSLRKNDLAQAVRDLQRARELAPESGAIKGLLGRLAEKQGRLPEAVGHLRSAVAQQPRDVGLLFALAEAISQEAGPDNDAAYQRLMEQILQVQPNNLPVLIQRASAAWRNKDLAAFRATVAHLERLAPRWSPRTRQALEDLRTGAAETPGEVPLLLQILDNLLKAEPGYVRDASAIRPQPGVVGTPLYDFLRLQPPRPTPAAPDRQLTFKVEPLSQDKAESARVVWEMSEVERESLLGLLTRGGLDARPAGTFKPVLYVANAQEVRRADSKGQVLAFPGGKAAVAPSPAGVLAVDWDNDFRTDLLLAGAGGLRFFQQHADGSFADVTAKTGLAADILGADYYGAWAADVEQDGDLDIVVAPRTGPPRLLRNNRDGTFKVLDVPEFKAVDGARVFLWADLDNDGAPDAAWLDGAGRLHIFGNERAGQFKPWLPAETEKLGTFVGLMAADVNEDGIFDLVALRRDGALLRIFDQGRREAWQTAELARDKEIDLAPGAVSLFAQDLDNNGALDVIVARPGAASVYLADEQFHFLAPTTVALQPFAVLDLDGDGRLDLLGLSPDGLPARALGQGSKKYHSQALWTIANPKEGDGRNNSFARGGEIEVRSGTLVQKQLIGAPMSHFGLGEHDTIAVARIVWPTGVPQLEFELSTAPLIVAAQRLTGSCPFLFTHDGSDLRFAGDFMWGTPLGMYVNAQKSTGADVQTTEWLKIPGHLLAPRDGYYDVRVQANLWETDYFDQLALLVVDHPPDTEIYADERFFLTPTPPRLYLTTPARPVARAWDHLGDDATEVVSAIDGRHLDRCGRGRFQGVTCDHWVEVDLGAEVPQEGPVYLIARGWVHPTDSSINVAIAQGQHEAPRGLTLEVPDGKGGWKEAQGGLGFPAGKNKTILIRLDGVGGVPRRLRLRTNMEIFWDFLGFARGLDAGLARVHRPEPHTAELRYHGVVEMTQKDASSPEVPCYDKVIHGTQPWRDLAGYYTRFGDVRELVARVDDRYVIMNAGDEIAFRYPAPSEPPAGWRRDFLWESDGWTRDGNANTRFGTTVLPLPAHGPSQDQLRPAALHDDPVYRRFFRDWQTYHTRYVNSNAFERGLRTFPRGQER